jgi:hypothetical protein
MRLYRCVLFASVLVMGGAPNAHSRDWNPANITCGAFLGSGHDNMSATIMWLRGYHAGKTGVIPAHSNVTYGGRLGFYCKQHPNASVIDASEQILLELDRGL